jgi:hypothetical protein
LDDPGKALELAVKKCLSEPEHDDAREWERLNVEVKKIGCHAWSWLQVMVVNFLYC